MLLQNAISCSIVLTCEDLSEKQLLDYLKVGCLRFARDLRLVHCINAKCMYRFLTLAVMRRPLPITYRDAQSNKDVYLCLGSNGVLDCSINSFLYLEGRYPKGLSIQYKYECDVHA